MNKYRLSFESVLTFFVLEEVDETCFSSLAFSGQSRKTADLGNLGLKVFHLFGGLRVFVSHVKFHTEDFCRLFGGRDNGWGLRINRGTEFSECSKSKLVKVQIRCFDT